MDIRHAVRYLRKQKGWTQSDLADRVHATNGSISNLENGQQGYSPSLLRYLSQAFGCSVSQIFLLAEHLEKPENKSQMPIELLFIQLPEDVQVSVRNLLEHLTRVNAGQ
jgi:transcriptional regulator with XRE-family HTH domain